MKSKEADTIEILKKNTKLTFILDKLPNNYKWYLAGGCVYQTVWNHLTNRDLNYGINDYDLLYFDTDTGYEKEDSVIKLVIDIFKYDNFKLDIKNQCRANLWYPKVFGTEIKPLTQIEDLKYIPLFTSACVWFYKENDTYKLYAPLGVNDIINLKLRFTSNTAIPKTFAKAKIDKWISKWPELELVN